MRKASQDLTDIAIAALTRGELESRLIDATFLTGDVRAQVTLNAELERRNTLEFGAPRPFSPSYS